MTKKFSKIFPQSQPVIGMIHVPALPGTPKYGGSIQAILDQVMEETSVFLKAGIDALMFENMHDVPYLRRVVGPEVTAAMSILGKNIKEESNLPCGVQLLSGANEEALAVALASGLDFIRAEGFVFGHVADEGLIESDAGTLLRYRKNIGAEHIAIFTDIKKKHSAHAITEDVSLQETAAAATFFLSDGLIITGTATGKPTKVSDLEGLKSDIQLPLIVGSGINLENVGEYLPLCDAMIVGSWFKKDGHWANELKYSRVAAFMEKVNKLRKD